MSIASEGGEYGEYNKKASKNSSELYIDRNPNKQSETPGDSTIIENTNEFDSWIKILYPHRLTQLVDLGKIFAATCEAILLLNNSEYEEDKYNRVQDLLKSLRENPTNPSSAENLEQKHYNGNLKVVEETIKSYFQQLKDSPISGSLIEIRNEIVKEIFKIIRR